MDKDARTLDALKDLGVWPTGAGRGDAPLSPGVCRVRCACVWSSKPAEHPTITAVLGITESLRVEGDLDARRLAEQIEASCRAAL